jgi:TRAP-type C4-dicarboxylate transport system permease small subunit
MGKILLAIGKFFVKTHEYTALVCGILFFLYMLNIVADVTGRYLFLYPILGTVEIGENVLAIAVFMTLAAVEMSKQNIRVTLLQDHLSHRGKAWLDILALVCGLLFVGLMMWQSLVLAKRSLAINETAINLPIPLYAGKIAFFVGCLLLCIQFAYELVNQIYNKFSGRSPEDKEVRG